MGYSEVLARFAAFVHICRIRKKGEPAEASWSGYASETMLLPELRAL